MSVTLNKEELITVTMDDAHIPSSQPEQQSFSCGQENDVISRKVAIDAFDGAKVDEENCTEYDIGYNDAIDFAVSKLSVLPSAQPVARGINVLSNDLISRQEAIDALSHMMDIDGFRDGWAVSRANVDCMLKALPSAQSDLLDAKEKDNRKKTEGYICGDTGEACTDCVEKCIYKHSLAEECEAVPEGGKKMMDLIERQMAIDALGERPMVWTDDDEYVLGERNQYDIDRLAIETVPSVQPERKKGKWVHRGCGVFECVQCGKLVPTNVYKAEKVSDSFKFCPECGLDMRGDQE